MSDIAELILTAGRSGVELALFVLLPVMIVMLTLMRLLEARGILDWVVNKLSPILRPFGIPGLGIFAMIQILLVSFAAPVATLAMMDRGGVSRRHIAATLAMVLALAQANVVFPMAAVGLSVWTSFFISLAAGILAASLTYHWFGRALPDEEVEQEPRMAHPEAAGARGILGLINRAGREALDISIAAMPMLVLALVVVHLLRSIGIIELLEQALAPLFALLDLPSATLLLIISKFVAGGMAMMAVAVDNINQGLITPVEFNRVAGLLIHPLDIAGVAVLISSGRRVASVLKPALMGASVAIALRALCHFMLF